MDKPSIQNRPNPVIKSGLNPAIQNRHNPVIKSGLNPAIQNRPSPVIKVDKTQQYKIDITQL